MIGNVNMSIKKGSDSDALALVFYMYQLSQDLDNLQAHEELQVLYNSLVDKLGLQKRQEIIYKMLINQRIESKRLHKRTNNDKRNPYSYKRNLDVSFCEDGDIYEECGNWETYTARDINLVRILFSMNTPSMTQLISLTFFASQTVFDNFSQTKKLPSKLPLPASIKKSLSDFSNIQFLIESLKLSKEESILLATAYRMNVYKEMYGVCNDLVRNDDMPRQEIYSKCLGVAQKEIRSLLKNDSNIKAFGFIDDNFDMDTDAVDCILEQNIQRYFYDIIKKEKKSKTYSLSSFSVKQDKSDLAVQLLKNDSPCNILLYGEPGAGKSEYAKALVKEAGIEFMSYKNELEVNGENASEKALSRLNCYLSLQKKDSILVVDEAETILKTSGNFMGFKYSLPQKGTVNKMLEKSENKVIWILNYTDELDESTLRRFTYSIRFHAMPKDTLRTIASKKVSKLPISSSLKNEILELCGKFQVTGASVDNIVTAIKGMDCSKENEQKVLQDVKNILESNSKLVFGNKKMRDTVRDSYNLSVLNTSTPAPEIVEMLENAEKAHESNLGDGTEGVRLLFYGLSGTGKTELVRYIAQKLGKKLLLKRASDILGMYVGESEKNIRDAFEEAEETDSILLFDEADSFFQNRENASRSWEITQVNEFLTQLEEFSGICICTTNLRKIMDPAMQRRFHIITEFKPLSKDGIKQMIKNYYPQFNFSEAEVEKLCNYDSVTPGDFGSLSGRMRFISNDKLSSEYIINELVQIQKEKMGDNRKVGFAS